MKKKILIIFAVVSVGVSLFLVIKVKNTPNLPTSADVTVGSGYYFSRGKIYFYGVSTNGPAPADWKANSDEVVGVDPTTFVPIRSPYYTNRWESGAYMARDARHLYIGSEEVVFSGPDAGKIDLGTFGVVASGVFKDQYSVYTLNDRQSLSDTEQYKKHMEVKKVEGADSATLAAVLDPEYSRVSTYAKDRNAVYFLEGGYGSDITVTKISNIDPGTFKVIGACAYPAQPSGAYGNVFYATDANHVLVREIIMNDVDSSTLKIIGKMAQDIDVDFGSPTVYSIDKNHVYSSCASIVPGVSPEQCTAANLKACTTNN